ncbi:putative Uncharacterized amino-acid permease C15C4.04c [Glarea lozoyensis 74030]|uniref:Putative Uncharacterized amino-acid permease C15C4.04c n=1 Tax=Glarea lozoyensis (strain ATCC 74030 / MF5533) TaxID=1104152 RepID=H0EW95_GLAL7|nr:putative Uncharacterized amino-acid permease C15C4.04c [Glarea lozoyensis 74030]
MTDFKDEGITTVNAFDDSKASNGSIEENSQSKSGGPAKAQVNILERYINPAAIINFGFTLQAAWEASGSSIQFSLLNGGPASLVWGSLLAGVGSTAIAISLAEMASLDPVVGAQYRWSAAFAPSNNAFWGLFQGR